MDKEFIVVYKSEILNNKPKEEMNFRKVYIDNEITKTLVMDLKLVFQLWKYNSVGLHIKIAQATVPIRQLKSFEIMKTVQDDILSSLVSKQSTSTPIRLTPQKTHSMTNLVLPFDQNKDGVSTGSFVISNIRIQKMHTFLNYVFGGVQIQTHIAIDFTNPKGKNLTKN